MTRLQSSLKNAELTLSLSFVTVQTLYQGCQFCHNAPALPAPGQREASFAAKIAGGAAVIGWGHGISWLGHGDNVTYTASQRGTFPIVLSVKRG